jgi:hypothetical protein
MNLIIIFILISFSTYTASASSYGLNAIVTGSLNVGGTTTLSTLSLAGDAAVSAGKSLSFMDSANKKLVLNLSSALSPAQDIQYHLPSSAPSGVSLLVATDGTGGSASLSWSSTIPAGSLPCPLSVGSASGCTINLGNADSSHSDLISLGSSTGNSQSSVNLQSDTFLAVNKKLIFLSNNAGNILTTSFIGSSLATANSTYTLPVASPSSSSFLTSDNTGLLSWSATSSLFNSCPSFGTLSGCNGANKIFIGTADSTHFDDIEIAASGQSAIVNIAVSSSSTGANANQVTIGSLPSATTATQSITIGTSAATSGTSNTITIGTTTASGGINSITIGKSVSTTTASANAITIGSMTAVTTGSQTITMGSLAGGSITSASQSITIGTSAATSGTSNTITMGALSSTSGTPSQTITIGSTSSLGAATQTINIGSQVSSTTTSTITVGGTTADITTLMGKLRFKSSGTGYAGFSFPASNSITQDYSLPPTAVGGFLYHDGTGVLSWSTTASGPTYIPRSTNFLPADSTNFITDTSLSTSSLAANTVWAVKFHQYGLTGLGNNNNDIIVQFIFSSTATLVMQADQGLCINSAGGFTGGTTTGIANSATAGISSSLRADCTAGIKSFTNYDGILSVGGTAGQLQLQAKCNSGSDCAILAGSYLELIQII